MVFRATDRPGWGSTFAQAAELDCSPAATPDRTPKMVHFRMTPVKARIASTRRLIWPLGKNARRTSRPGSSSAEHSAPPPRSEIGCLRPHFFRGAELEKRVGRVAAGVAWGGEERPGREVCACERSSLCMREIVST